jgi:hypothetical protein
MGDILHPAAMAAQVVKLIPDIDYLHEAVARSTHVVPRGRRGRAAD